MVILLKITKNRNFSLFYQFLFTLVCVLPILNDCRVTLEIISKSLNSFQGFIRQSGGGFMLILLKITRSQYFSWFQQPLSSLFGVLPIFNYCQFKMETVARYLDRFETFIRLPGGNVLS